MIERKRQREREIEKAVKKRGAKTKRELRELVSLQRATHVKEIESQTNR